MAIYLYALELDCTDKKFLSGMINPSPGFISAARA
jgi:hypothetical protein